MVSPLYTSWLGACSRSCMGRFNRYAEKWARDISIGEFLFPNNALVAEITPSVVYSYITGSRALNSISGIARVRL